MISLCCKVTKFPFSYSYKILSYTTFSGLHWKPDCGLSRTRDSGHAGPCSAVTSCRCSGWFSHGERLLFRRQNFCFHLHLDGTTWHLLHSHSWRNSHPAKRAMTEVSLLLIPRCPHSNFATKTECFRLSDTWQCFCTELHNGWEKFTTAQHLLNCYHINIFKLVSVSILYFFHAVIKLSVEILKKKNPLTFLDVYAILLKQI